MTRSACQHRRDARDPRKQLTPSKQVEREYRTFLRRRVDWLATRIEAVFDDWLETRRADIARRADAFRLDAGVGADVADWMARIRGLRTGIRRERDESGIESRVERIARQVASLNMAAQRRLFEDLAGRDPVDAPDVTKKLLDDFAARNLDLVTGQDGLEDRALDQCEAEVVRGLREGQRPSDLADTIEERLGVARSRAELIADDQIGKLNGQLTAARHKAAGIRKFRWMTARDSRVRPEHQKLHGKVFRYDDPPSEGMPGEPIRCRCVAVPILESETVEVASGAEPDVSPATDVLVRGEGVGPNMAVAA